jgi:hypothetical protein
MDAGLLFGIVCCVAVVGLIVYLSGPAQRWRGGRRIRRMRDAVEGTLEVTAASVLNTAGSAHSANYWLTGILHLPGLPPTPVENRGMARTAKWPHPGDTLPVTADRSRPSQLVIHWERMATGRERARVVTENLARKELQASADTGFGRAQPGWPGAAGQPVPPSAGDPSTPTVGPRTGLDARAMSEALARAQQPAAWTAQAATGTVPGTVIAATPVRMPAGMAPMGGVWDLTVRTAGRAVTVRAECQTLAEAQAVAWVGATVMVALDPTNPDVATLVTAGGWAR